MYAILLLLFLCACSSDEPDRPTGEFIYRNAGEYQFRPALPEPRTRGVYPWEEGKVANLPRITKEFFRCKGNPLNPPKTETRGGETLTILDCGGADKHSLPLMGDKENVYPILIDILNYIQNVTKKRVVITSGHRCPDHNTYCDSSSSNQISKHLVGAEVSFYVQGMEDKPDAIVEIIKSFYLQDTAVKGDKKYAEFKRYDKDDTHVSTQPWMNHEVFIKLFNRKEGRDFDNRHPYAYLSLQVRHDRIKEARVIYTWDKAYNNFLRY